jgi:hypothetical protein
MESYTAYKGDYGFTIDFELNNYDSTDKDITGYKPYLKVWYQTIPAVLLFSGSTTITSASAGLCAYTVLSTDIVATGTFNGEIELQNTTTNFYRTWDQFKLIIKESP